jgi:16S rRNA processing protein RimM
MDPGVRGSERDTGADGFVEIGFVQKPVGLEGWCAVSSQGGTLGGLRLPFGVFLGARGRVPVERRLLAIRRSPKGFACLFEGCDNRECAEQLRGLSVLVPENCLPPLPGARFYHFELAGMSVVSGASGAVLGVVAEVHDYPTVDALEVRKEDGQSVLVPMTGEYINSIDKKIGRITVSVSSLDDIYE